MTLSHALRAGDLASVKEAIDAGADVNARGPDGFTPLMIASALGQAQAVALLLTAGADVLAADPRMGATALHKAAQSGSADVIEILLDNGAFIDQQSPVLGNTALMDAVLHKHEAAVRTLLARRARTAIRNYWQQTALEIAKHDGLQSIAALIEERDTEDARYIASLPIVSAVKTGNLEEVKRLIAEGADFEVRVPVTGTFDDDYTPLGLAVREGHAEIVRFLLDAGADPRRTIGLMRGSPLHDAAYFGKSDHIDILVSPTKRGQTLVELDAQGPYNGLTALHDAVWHGYVGAVVALVHAGARRDLKTHSGLTPLSMATLYGYDEIVEILSTEPPTSPVGPLREF
ncbi:ankyrin repeat domain-containing protein [Agrobacterium pusense]|uniref:ankyrin repeat domain-containing protein n=1 Tax=Agrobacterium pusense TaxID=648995 RepID=UPI001C6EBE7E|nr:ankyrin repeat domain-containing protein [Agrobacterium pusense]MBW9070162.1 ankyrin repeat domain-containing protein [Agrobacterium pusense]MBW9084998.1 ankyrin repeat domain-containing protein [Agrobacterium pusense]MBW9125527.1 ankyrin repeat domain-containing protein [Agrobacterium pusense]MBW9137942.1 ankyrin repeat domain-containing protein [Agrobacterium pusense]